MPPLNVLLLFLLASLTLNISPGPDMLYVLSCGARQGQRAGLVSTLGITVGSLIQACVVALGLASILTAVPIAYEIVKYLGAAYLIYLGVRTLLSRQHSLSVQELEHTNLWRVFLQGVVTNVLNPKVALFFLAFLPQFTDPSGGPIPLQLLILGIIFNISGTVVNSVVALLASVIGVWLKRNTTAAKILNWLTGSIFIGLGVRLALLERQ